MPELPEVEVIARGLAKEVVGRKIASVEVPWPTSLRQPVEVFTDRLLDAEITGVRRRAKLLLLDLDKRGLPGLVLAAHLKMTGRMVHSREGADEGYDRVRFGLDNGSGLVFSDMRRFGHIQALTPDELAEWSFYKNLGPEPLETDDHNLLQRFLGRTARIKGLLLDQTVIAGVGNIYADESLHRSGIRPDEPASRLGREDYFRLFGELRSVLRQAIAENGSSIRDYRDAGGNAGAFQNSFLVYGRCGKLCCACKTELTTMTVAGRTSTFCPTCQPRKASKE